jgi:hypothetical protein
VKILLGNFSSKVGRVDIFKAIIGSDSLHKINNDNGVKIVNFASSKNLLVKDTVFSFCNIHKNTLTSPEGKPHNQIDHVLIDIRWHPNIVDVQSVRIAVILIILWRLQKFDSDCQ